MFGRKRRGIEIQIVKHDKTNSPEEKTEDNPFFRRNAEYVMRKLDRTGVKIFAGICVYVMLDTIRQVAVEKAKHEPQPEK